MATKKAAKKAAAPAKKAAAAKPAKSEPTSSNDEVKHTDGATTQVTLPAGKGTQNTEPPASNPPPLERDVRSKNNPGIIKTDDAEDTVRRQKDKARWEYGAGESDSTVKLMAEQREITAASKDDE